MLFASAERHGLSGVVLDAWRAQGLPLPPDLARSLDTLSVARALDHDAHVALLKRIDVRFAAASRDDLKIQIQRRAQAAQDRIAQAETAAMNEIRALAADAAASAAQKLILARMDEKRAGNLIADSIKDLSTKLN